MILIVFKKILQQYAQGNNKQRLCVTIFPRALS